MNVELCQIVSGDHMAAEGELVAKTSVNHIVDSLPVPVPPLSGPLSTASVFVLVGGAVWFVYMHLLLWNIV